VANCLALCFLLYSEDIFTEFQSQYLTEVFHGLPKTPQSVKVFPLNRLLRLLCVSFSVHFALISSSHSTVHVHNSWYRVL